MRLIQTTQKTKRIKQFFQRLFKSKKREVHLSAKQAYNLLAENYHQQGFNLLETLANEKQKNLVPQLKGCKTVLDYGCGNGRNIPFLKSLSPIVIGVDVSEKMVEQCQKRFPNISTHAMGVHFNLADAIPKVDLIYCNLSLGYIEDLTVVFRNWNKVLSPKGKVLILDMHPNLNPKGQSRNFVHQDQKLVIKSYPYSIEQLNEHFMANNWTLLDFEELRVNYELILKHKSRVNLQPFKDKPVLYAYLLQKN